MKRTIALTIALWLFSATLAFAFPGPTVHHVGGWWWQAPRTIGTYIGQIIGFNRMSVVYTHNNGCLQVIVTSYAGPFVTGQTVTEMCP